MPRHPVHLPVISGYGMPALIRATSEGASRAGSYHSFRISRARMRVRAIE
jgi:hypothetical protein